MKHLLSLSIILGATSVALAQPTPAKVCAPSYGDGTTVTVTGGNAVACWKTEGAPDKCIAASPTTNPKIAAAPAKAAAVADVREENGAWVACAGTTCKKLGKKMTAAIKKAVADPDAWPKTAPQVTADLKMVAFGRAAWLVDKDKAIKVKAPKEYKKVSSGDKPGLGSIDVAGNFLVASWSDCAGPCTMAVAVDASGANKSPWFPAGMPIALDGNRIAIIPQEASATVTVLDGTTAKVVGSLVINEGVLDGLTGAKVDGNTVAALWNDEGAWKLAWIAIPAGGAPTLGATKSIPHCP